MSEYLNLSNYPKDWDFIYGDAFLTLGGGVSPSNLTFSENGNTPFMKVDDFNHPDNYGYIKSTKLKFDKENNKTPLAKSSSIIIAKRGAAIFKNRVRITEQVIAVDTNLMTILVDKAHSPLYFRYLLELINLTSIADTTSIPQLNNFHLNEAVFAFPPLSEQQKIAQILTSVDDVIEKTQTQIDKLKGLKTGMMQELLTNGIDHTEFKDSPVGRIPVEWEVKPLSQLALKISDGIHSTPKYADSSGYYFINGNNLKKGEVIFGKNTKFVSWEEYNKHKKDLGKNTILMSINGTIGNLAYYEGEEVVLGKSASFISLKEEQSRSFIFYVLQSERIKAFYDLELTGSTIRNLSLRAIKETPIALPSESEQIEITKILSSVDSNLKLKNKRLIALQNTKKALMQDLLTGKIRVKTETINTEVAVG